MFRMVFGASLATSAAVAQMPAPAPVTTSAASPATFPEAIPPERRSLVRVQVLLDRAHFSPGVIDGKDGGNLRLAVSAYQAANKLPVDGAVTSTLVERLAAADSGIAVARYTITDADVAGPFVNDLPTDYADLAKLDSPAYSSAAEELAERFHMDEQLLRQMNPSVDLGKAGTVIAVAAVDGGKLPAKVVRIEIDKSTNAVRARAADGMLLAVYPATVGSIERPAPSGTWKVRTVATKATYTFDPRRLTFGKPGTGKLTIKAGPNNPVGTTWIDLTKDTYGIHGTPDPRLIGKRASHGCVRMTNWDAEQLGKSVEAGAVVVFSGSEQRATS